MIPVLKLPLSVDCQPYLLIAILIRLTSTSCYKLVFSEPEPDIFKTHPGRGLPV